MQPTAAPLGGAPVLSVVIPVRNGERDLSAQLEALSEQALDQPWEVIVADNGSTDGTIAVAEKFKGVLPQLRVVNAADRLGQAHAVNVGVAEARGTSLVLLDADDLVAPGYLSAMASALDQHPFVAARMDCDTLNPPWLRRSRPPTQTDDVGAPFGFLPSAAGCSMGIWRSAFDLVEGFDPAVMAGNDVDFCWRVQLAGHRLTFVPDAVVRYRYRDSFRGIFSQARSYGAAGPVLYRRYRDRGMTRRSRRTALRFHGAALIRLARVRSKSDLASVLFLFGFRLGIIEGCIRNRVLYL